jgi:hypothetical protein
MISASAVTPSDEGKSFASASISELLSSSEIMPVLRSGHFEDRFIELEWRPRDGQGERERMLTVPGFPCGTGRRAPSGWDGTMDTQCCIKFHGL